MATPWNILAWTVLWTEAWQAVVHRVAKSRTQLKWLSTFTVDGNVNWYHYGKEYGDSSNIKRRSTMWPTNLTSWFISKGMKQNIKKLSALQCLLQLYLWQPRYGNHKCLSMNEWIKKVWCMYKMWNTIQPRERRESFHLLQHQSILRALC